MPITLTNVTHTNVMPTVFLSDKSTSSRRSFPAKKPAGSCWHEAKAIAAW